MEEFKKAQDHAMELMGEMNEATAKLAIHLYKSADENFSIEKDIDPETKVTVGELYAPLNLADSVKETELSLTVGEYKELPDEVFIGEGRTLPVANLESAMFLVSLIDTIEETNEDLKKKVAKAALKYGLSYGETVEFVPLLVLEHKLISFETAGEEVNKKIDAFASAYGLDEDTVEGAKNFVTFVNTLQEAEDLAPLVSYEENESGMPTVLDNDFLLSYFKQNEEGANRDFLAALVGVVRANKISKEEIDKASKAYSALSTKVLENLLKEGVPTGEREDNNNTGNQVTLLESDEETAPEKSSKKTPQIGWKVRKKK
jgi:hypothetical protein